MAYLKGVLGTVAALFLAVLIPMFWTTFRGISSEKQTGLTAVAGGLLESLVSPWFWILALLFSVFFYFSSRFDIKVLRILLFWIPTIAASVTGFGCWALCTFLVLRFGRG
jgi:hypothetical protein